MSGRKGWFLAIAVSLGLSMGFTGQYALASEPDAEVIEINDEAEDICLYADENGYFYQTADETHFYYVDAATGEQTAAQLVEIPEGDYAGIYYFGDDGYAVTDVLLTVDESVYYFSSDAKAVTDSLVNVDESAYYFGSDGKALKDAFQTVDDSTYYFGTDGVMYTGTGLKTIGDSKYYFVDGVVKTGWQTMSDGSTYYFKKTSSETANKGTMLTGFKKIGSYKYYFGTNGKLKTGWQTIDGSTYYFKKSASDTLRKGTMLTGLKKIGDYKYYFGTNGKMRTGWQTINGNKYYFKKSASDTLRKGTMLTGLKKIGSYKYYFNSSGQMRKSAFQTINNKRYYFDSNGRMVTDTRKKIGGNLYYFNSSGVLYRTVYGNKKMVALTYDDGPSKYTSTILDTLKKYDSVATFFVVGDRVSTYSDTVKRAYNMDCQIANHTYSHTILTKVSVSKINSEISKANAAVKKVTGESPIMLRTPGGAVNSTVKSNAGMPIILWSIDTLDWKTRDSGSTINAVINHVSDGDIVLMHDLYSATATASKTIIPKLTEKGYQLVTVEEMAVLRGGAKSGTVYYSFRQ